MSKKTWIKTIFVVCDAAILVYIVFVMVSFSKPLTDNSMICSEVNINIEKGDTPGFLTSRDVKNILVAQKLYPLGQNLLDVNTRNIEDYLKSNTLIENAECYQTLKGKIFINLAQRQPVLRIKSINGDDYYLDCKGKIISDISYSSNQIVASGYISQRYAKKYLTGIGRIFVKNSFWNSEIEQINVLKDGSVELVPRVGNHIVYLGEPFNIERKLKRLYDFYVYGLNKIGWNKYQYINLEFDNQIICRK